MQYTYNSKQRILFQTKQLQYVDECSKYDGKDVFLLSSQNERKKNLVLHDAEIAFSFISDELFPEIQRIRTKSNEHKRYGFFGFIVEFILSNSHNLWFYKGNFRERWTETVFTDSYW